MTYAALYFQCIFCKRTSNSRPDCLNETGARFEPDICERCLRTIEGESSEEEHA